MKFRSAGALDRGLLALFALKDGWNFGRGKAPSFIARVHSAAGAASARSHGATELEFFPEDDGGIFFIAYQGNESFEILARSDGTWEVAFEDDSGLKPAKSFDTLTGIESELELRGWQSQKSSDSYTRLITVSKSSDTHLLLFDHKVVASQSLTWPVSQQGGAPFANTSNISIPARSGVRQQSFGESKQRNLVTVGS